MKNTILRSKDVEISIVKRVMTEDKLNNMYRIVLWLKFEPAAIVYVKHGKRLEATEELTVCRVANIINKDHIEIEEDFDLRHGLNKLELEHILNIEEGEFYNYLDETTIEELRSLILHQHGGSMTYSSSEPLCLTFNSYRPNKEKEEETSKQIELSHPELIPTDEEKEFFERNYVKSYMQTIKKHYSSRLLQLYPSGLGLNRDLSNQKEYDYYICLIDLIDNANNFTDVMNIIAKYDLDIYRNRFDSYRPIPYLCAKFNALILNLAIIQKYDGKYGYLKSATKLTGKTLEYYMTGYISSYNKKTIERINTALGMGQLLYMI